MCKNFSLDIKMNNQYIMCVKSLSWYREVEEVKILCCVRGYHIYKVIQAAAIGEEIDRRREPTNFHDKYAVL